MDDPIRLQGDRATIVRSGHSYTATELQRLAELGRLSASLLHEISNPLAAAMLYAEQGQDGHPGSLKQIRHSLKLLHRYVEAARQQARLESGLAEFELSPQISQIKRLLLPLAKRAGVGLVFETTPRCMLFGDPVRLQQVLSNLIVNAIEAYANDTAPGLDKPVHVRFIKTGRRLVIRVADWGEGIAAAVMPQVFNPFYTTKSSSGHGLGIGLAIVKQYVTDDFRGSISARSTRRGGTIFTVKLPLIDRRTE